MDFSADKRRHLEEKQRKRDQSSPSILDSYHDAALPVGEIQEAEGITEKNKPEVCYVCNGKRVVKGLFKPFECAMCAGTGFDLSHPVAVIKWQAACMEWAKKEVIDLRQKLAVAGKSTEELEAEAVGRFYDNANRLD